jgi:O-antigen/teichoic acid export membrane protein
VGVARYEIPAATSGGARLVAGLGLVAAALRGCSIITMAAIVGTINLASYAVQYLMVRRIVPDLRFRSAMVRFSTAREISGYCFGLTVMSAAMFLITGLDLLLVGRFDFAVVVPYSVAASVVALMTGLVSSIVGVILPHAATLHARERPAELGELVVSATRISVLLLILAGLPMVIYAGPILRVWIGQKYVMSGVPILSTLLVANMIRLIGAPYATVLVGAGQQNYIKVSPLAEGVSNFVASVVLGLFWGGIGVAAGTLLGSFVSIGAHLFYSVPRTRSAIGLSRRHLVTAGVMTPVLCTCPLIVAAVANWKGQGPGSVGFGMAMLFSLLGAGLLLMRTHIAPKSRFNLTGQENELY